MIGALTPHARGGHIVRGVGTRATAAMQAAGYH